MHVWECHNEQQAFNMFTPEILLENDKLRKQLIKRAIIIEASALWGILR